MKHMQWIALCAALIAGAASAQKQGNLEIDAPWARATPPGASIAGGYASIMNRGAAPDKLLSASSRRQDHSQPTETPRLSLDMGSPPLGCGTCRKRLLFAGQKASALLRKISYASVRSRTLLQRVPRRSFEGRGRDEVLEASADRRSMRLTPGFGRLTEWLERARREEGDENRTGAAGHG